MPKTTFWNLGKVLVHKIILILSKQKTKIVFQRVSSFFFLWLYITKLIMHDKISSSFGNKQEWESSRIVGTGIRWLVSSVTYSNNPAVNL